MVPALSIRLGGRHCPARAIKRRRSGAGILPVCADGCRFGAVGNR